MHRCQKWRNKTDRGRASVIVTLAVSSRRSGLQKCRRDGRRIVPLNRLPFVFGLKFHCSINKITKTLLCGPKNQRATDMLINVGQFWIFLNSFAGSFSSYLRNRWSFKIYYRVATIDYTIATIRWMLKKKYSSPPEKLSTWRNDIQVRILGFPDHFKTISKVLF